MTDLFAVAIHEAAHAVLHAKLRHKLRKDGAVSIEPKGDFLGYVNTNYKGKHEDHIVCSLAGGIADHYATRRLADGLCSDADEIIRRLRNLLDDKSLKDAASVLALRNRLGKSSGNRWAEGFNVDTAAADRTIETVRSAVYALCNSDRALDALGMFHVEAALNLAQAEWFQKLGALADETRRLVLEHWQIIYAVAGKLAERGQIPGPEVEAFITGKPYAPVQRSEEEQRLRKEVSQVRNTISRLYFSFLFCGRREPTKTNISTELWVNQRENLARTFPPANARLRELESLARQKGWTLPKWRYNATEELCREFCKKTSPENDLVFE